MKYTFKVILTFLIFNSSFLILNAQVGVNDDNSSPDASAMLDVKSATKGILIPRMTTTERDNISSTATGLMIYNTTTNKFNYYNGTAWTVIGEDNLGNHTTTTNLQIGTNYISNDGNSEGISIDNKGSVTVTTDALTPNPAKFQSNFNGASFIEINNKAGTRALFGADGSHFTGSSTSDVTIGNWSNGALNFYSNATKRVSISNTGLFLLDGSFKLTNGSQGANKALVSDAAGLSTWTSLSEIPTAHDTTQPTPIKYRGYIIYVHPTDNATNLDWATAKTTCANLTAFGKSDWYLPTRTELDAMYKQSYLISGLSDTEIVKYWSSSAKDATYAYTQRLDYGGPDPDAKTDTSGHNCRCVRKN